MLDFFIANALSILYLSLAFMLVGITIFIIPVLIRLAGTLKNVNRITADIGDTVELVQGYLWQPARLAISMKAGILNLVEMAKGFLKK